MKAKKSMSMKAVVILMVVVLLIGCAAGGTLAWLMTRTSEVKNTFVAGNVGELKLEESKKPPYMIIPGVDIEKDPVVTFSGNNVPAYVFLEVKAADWTCSDDRMTYTINSENTTEGVGGTGDHGMFWSVADGWTPVDGVANVYCRTVDADATEQTWPVIADDKITVCEGITKESIKDYEKDITFTAYAIQQADGGAENEGKFTPAEAWALAQTAAAPTTP